MVKARVKKTNSSRVLKEEEQTIIRLQDEIFKYADKHNFYVNFLDMSSEAFKEKDPNPWLTIAKKACLLGGTTYEEFVSSGITKQYEHELSLKQAKLDWYKSKFGNFDHEYAFEVENPIVDSNVDLKNSNCGNVISPAPSTQNSFSSLSPLTPELQNLPAAIEEPSKLIENVKTKKPSAPIEKQASPTEKQTAAPTEKPQSALKLKLLLPQDMKNLAVVASDLSRTLSRENYNGLMRDKAIDVDKAVNDTSLKLKLNLREEAPMTKIPEQNLKQCINELDQPKKLTNIFARKRKDKKLPINTEKNELVEAPAVNEQVENVQEVNETLFKLKIKLPTVSQVTITNAEVTTPTGNILLPPIIAFDSETKSDNEDQPMDVDIELTKNNPLESCTSEDLFPNIENELKSMFEDNQNAIVDHEQAVKVAIKEDQVTTRTPTLDKLKMAESNSKGAHETITEKDRSADSLILTQNELLEIEEITALKFTPSRSSMKSSEENYEDEMKMEASPVKTSKVVQNLSEVIGDHEMQTPVKTIKAVKNPTSGGKNLAMIVLQSIENSRAEAVQLETITDQLIIAIDTESSEEIAMKIEDNEQTPSDNKEMSIRADNDVHVVVPEKPKIYTLGSDDFEPDYEP